MTNGAISDALQRRLDRPDIHKPVDRNVYSFDQTVREMILDLKEHVPSLSIRQLSSLVGVGKTFVTEVLDQTVPAERWTDEDNPASAAAELAALQFHHPEQRYEDHPDAANEYDPVPVLFTAPQPRDFYRVADQSHAVRKPITLPQFPFLPLPDRYTANNEERYAA